MKEQIIEDAVKDAMTDYREGEDVEKLVRRACKTVANHFTAEQGDDDVVGRSELLISFSEYLHKRDLLNVVKEHIPIRVKLFLKRNYKPPTMKEPMKRPKREEFIIEYKNQQISPTMYVRTDWQQYSKALEAYIDHLTAEQGDNIRIKDVGNTPEFVNFLLRNALRHLDYDNRRILAESLHKRTQPQELTVIDWKEMRNNFFNKCTTETTREESGKKVNMAPHDLFEWFKREISEYVG